MKFTVRDFLSSIFRHARALIVFWAVILVAAILFYSQTKKLYDSKAKILISLGTEALGKADYINGKNLQLLQREQQIHNEQEILESHQVMITTAKWILGDPTPGVAVPVPDDRLNEARRFLTGEEPQPTFLLRLAEGAAKAYGNLFGHPKTHAERLEDMAQALSNSFTVKPVFDSDALDASFRYRDANVAQTVLQMIISAYLNHHIAVFQSGAEADLLKSQLDRSVDQYHDRLGDFSSFMTRHQVFNDDSQVTVLIEQREKLKQVLNEALAETEAAAARLAAINSIDQSLKQFERYSTTEVRNKEREALLARLDETAVEEQALLTRHPKTSRAYQEEESKLEELRHLVEKEPAQVVQETEQRRSKASEFAESEIINLTETQRGNKARVDRLREDLRNVDAELNNYAHDLKGFNSLKQQLTFAKQESEQMAQVYVASRLKNLTSQHAITDISIIDAPTWDPTPASPKKKLVIAATILLLVLGSFAVILAGIGLDTTVTDTENAEARLGAPVTATFSSLKEAPGTGDFSDRFARENHREFARIYQSIRDTASRDNSREGRVVLLTESNPGEGASLVGYSLAAFLSRDARERTAFVDRTEHPFLEGAREAAADRPAVVAWPRDSVANDVASQLTRLRQEYAYVVIAAGAVRDATDLLALGGLVSGTLFIVEAGKTRRAVARYSLDLLRRYGYQSIGLILNKRVFYIPAWLMRFV